MKVLIINFALCDRLASSIVAVNLMCIDVFKSALIMHISNIGFYSFFKLFDYYSFDVWMCIWGCSFHEIIEPIGIRPLTAHTYTCIYKYMDLESLAIHPSKSIWTGQYRKNRTMKTIFKTLFYMCKIFL